MNCPSVTTDESDRRRDNRNAATRLSHIDGGPCVLTFICRRAGGQVEGVLHFLPNHPVFGGGCSTVTMNSQ